MLSDQSDVEKLVTTTAKLIDAARNSQAQSRTSTRQSQPAGNNANDSRLRNRPPVVIPPSIQTYGHPPYNAPHPQTPQEYNSHSNAQAWAAFNHRPPPSNQRHSYHQDAQYQVGPRPGTAGSAASGAGQNRSPRVSTDGVNFAPGPPQEKTVHFERSAAGSIRSGPSILNASSTRQRGGSDRHSERRSRRDYDYDAHRDTSDDSEYERQLKKEKRKKNKRAAKVIGGLGALTAVLETLDGAFI